MRRRSRLAIVVLVLVAPAVGVMVLDDGSGAAGQPIAGANGTSGGQEFDSTTFELTVYENGTARFAVQYERRLSNETEEEQFRTFAERFENESTTLSENFRARASTLVSTGENATGRAMTASTFDRTAVVRERFNTLGIVELSFHWSGFAPVRSDGSVVVGDVFEGGIYLGGNQALVLRAGPGVRFDSIDPTGSLSGDTLESSSSVTYTGELEFANNRPRAVLLPVDGDASETTAGGDGTTRSGSVTGRDTQASGGDGVGGIVPMLAIALVVVLLLAFAYREYGGSAGSGGGDRPAAGGGESSAAEATGSPSSTETGGAGGGAAVTEEELLTDEDRVQSLLEENGGRMRQVNIVETTGWSKSKVSMLLSDMEEEGTITKLRVGRENIVSLEGHEPDVAGSPFDSEDDT